MFTVSFENKHDLHAQLQKLHLLPEPEKDVTTSTMSVEDLLQLLEQALPGKAVQVVDLATHEVTKPVEPAPAAEKRKRGRPPKAKAEPAQEAVPEESPLSPDDAMNKAMEILTPLYNDDGGKEAVLALRDKYGVKKFALLPMERAHELLSDALALQAQLKEDDEDMP